MLINNSHVTFKRGQHSGNFKSIEEVPYWKVFSGKTHQQYFVDNKTFEEIYDMCYDTNYSYSFVCYPRKTLNRRHKRWLVMKLCKNCKYAAISITEEPCKLCIYQPDSCGNCIHRDLSISDKTCLDCYMSENRCNYSNANKNKLKDNWRKR